MHRTYVVMNGQRLNKWVVFRKLTFYGMNELHDRLLTFLTALCTPMLGRSKKNIVAVSPKFSGRTVIIVCSCNDSTVYFADQVLI